ncbi:antitoxin YezG family protein [Cohnella panacarvi]|uniref:antitoxin YezG family protein n=1 Tax=Cohnella panacarvi TaxID=400776 RepID=UPI000479E914|nr:antitoxin YezG family protein [Cohnella panacarvi]
MDELKLNTIYQKIAATVIETIPEDWSKVFVYGEVAEDVRTAFFYYYPIDSNIPTYSHDIPNICAMEKEDYKILWRQLLDHLQELWREFNTNGQDVWTNITMIFDNQGDFKIDYDYEDLSEADDHERGIIWEYNHLGLIPEDEDDKEFLDNHLKSLKDDTEEQGLPSHD